MRCRAENVFISTCAANTAASSSSSRAYRGTRLRISMLQAMQEPRNGECVREQDGTSAGWMSAAGCSEYDSVAEKGAALAAPCLGTVMESVYLPSRVPVAPNSRRLATPRAVRAASGGAAAAAP